MTPTEKEMWIDWTHDAMSAYSKSDELDDPKEIVTDMISVATDYADGMLDEYEERFGGSGAKRSRKRKKPKEEDDDDDD